MFKEIMAATEHNNLKPIQTKNKLEINYNRVLYYSPSCRFIHSITTATA